MKADVETMGQELHLQWHPASCSAIMLEMVKNKKELEYEPEFNLNRKPAQIDLLVIKKRDDVCIENEIGRLFRRYNVMEFKSPDDSCSVDTYYKALAYACLYKTEKRGNQEIPVDEITISIVRQRKPVKLLAYLQETAFEMEMPFPGIYYARKKGLFDCQIIVTKELDPQKHRWITSLTKGLAEDTVRQLLSLMDSLENFDEKQCADSVLNFVMEANRDVFRVLKKEDRGMCKALMELMKPEIDEALKAAKEEGTASGLEIGHAKAVRMFQYVMKKLAEAGRFDDLKCAVEDEDMLYRFAEEFGYSE